MPQETLIAYGEAAPVLHSLGGVNIVRLSQNLVLKFGNGVLVSEAETMRYVMTTFPRVRLPKVYRSFSIDYPSFFDAKGYIVMDYVDGRSLDSCWDQLSHEAQQNVVTQVAAMINQLQSIRSDTPGVIGGGISRGIWFSDYGAGPFPTKEVFEKWINWKLGLSKFFKRAVLEVPQIECHYFVLIHGDLSPRNLVLDAYNRVWLIDWGCAGFYPPIFEAAAADLHRCRRAGVVGELLVWHQSCCAFPTARDGRWVPTVGKRSSKVRACSFGTYKAGYIPIN